MDEDMRWKQRFSNFNKALNAICQAFDVDQQILSKTVARRVSHNYIGFRKTISLSYLSEPYS